MKLQAKVLQITLSIILIQPLISLAEGPLEQSKKGKASTPPKEITALHEEIAKLSSLVLEQQKRISALEGKVLPTNTSSVSDSSDLSTQKPSSTSTPDSSQSLSPLTSPTNLRIPSSKPALLPEIGVVADILGTTSDSIPNDEGNNQITLREMEVTLGSDIDPYSRLDATIAFSDQESPSIEEGYVSYWGLPAELKGRIGKFHPILGKAVSTHRDSLETIDEPLAIQRYFGGEGISKAGIELTRFLPFATERYTPQLTLGLIEGGVSEEGELLADNPNRPSLYAHLGNSIEFSDLSDLSFGGTYLLGSSDSDRQNEVNLFGIDATFTYHLSPINKLKFQNEIYLVENNGNRDLEFTPQPTTVNKKANGFYSLLDFRITQRWGTGMRYDRVEPIYIFDEYSKNSETAVTAYLTFFQSEFARWRFEMQRVSLLDDREDNRFFLQGTFAIGTHKHQIQ